MGVSHLKKRNVEAPIKFSWLFWPSPILITMLAPILTVLVRELGELGFILEGNN